ncbi:hypothetical protein BDV97DRAFT_397029 [Delphinella strobiligena]|nr:hypothetical protein BDV97DRAFT_397029 [Delphinella strobiligena]
MANTMTFPAITAEVQAVTDAINACPADNRVLGLPTRKWLARQSIPGVRVRWSVFSRTDNAIIQHVGDGRLFSQRLWAFMLHRGAAKVDGEGDYEAKYEREFGAMLGIQLGQLSAINRRAILCGSGAAHASAPQACDKKSPDVSPTVATSSATSSRIAAPRQVTTNADDIDDLVALTMAPSRRTWGKRPMRNPASNPTLSMPLDMNEIDEDVPAAPKKLNTSPPSSRARGKRPMRNAAFNPTFSLPLDMDTSDEDVPVAPKKLNTSPPARIAPGIFSGTGLCDDKTKAASKASRPACTNDKRCNEVVCDQFECHQMESINWPSGKPSSSRFQTCLCLIDGVCSIHGFVPPTAAPPAAPPALQSKSNKKGKQRAQPVQSEQHEAPCSSSRYVCNGPLYIKGVAVETERCNAIFCDTCKNGQWNKLNSEQRKSIALGALMPMCSECQVKFLNDFLPAQSPGNALPDDVEDQCHCYDNRCFGCLKMTALKLSLAREEWAMTEWEGVGCLRKYQVRANGRSLGFYKCPCGQEVTHVGDGVRVCAICRGKTYMQSRHRFNELRGQKVVYLPGCEAYLE